MRNLFPAIKFPGVFSLLSIIPFLLMEIFNRRNYDESFPIPLFVLLWGIALAFFLILFPLIHNKATLKMGFLHLVIRIVIMAALAYMWFAIVGDQMPCFLGLENCD